MLRVTIEVFPFGSVRRSKTIRTALIINSGTGNTRRANYVVEFYDEKNKLWKTVEVKKFLRSLGPYCLLHEALVKVWEK